MPTRHRRLRENLQRAYKHGTPQAEEQIHCVPTKLLLVPPAAGKLATVINSNQKVSLLCYQ
jgi:hypothetical protein